MQKEFIIKRNEQALKVFIQNGFYPSTTLTPKLHKHNYSEVHIVANGSARFNAGENAYTLNSGSMIIVPKGVFHCFDSKDKETLHSAFQIDYKLNEISIYDIGNDIALKYMEEVEKTNFSQDYSKISTYITLFCDYFCKNEKFSAFPVADYGFLICEFLATHYSENLHISDLAKVLNLSERQTERLVIKYTGNTFKNELAAVRINVAKKLLSSSKLSLTEISQYVGYQSYAGFWKSMQRQATKNNPCTENLKD